MSDSGEPSPKKSKVSSESDTSKKDRLILAGKKLFSVNSENLASKSEYFRALFQSDFKEKEQKLIELKEISAESFEQFLFVIERPEDFKATKGKVIDLIATLAYFNDPDPLKIILKNHTNFDKIPRKELLELAKTFGLPVVTEIVEDVYIENFKKLSDRIFYIPGKYHQLHLAVEYGMKRLETMILDLFTTHFNNFNYIMPKILIDDSELGKKVYERIKTSVFEAYLKKNTDILAYFFKKMSRSQFEDIKLFATRYLIAQYPRTHHWKIIYFATFYGVEPLKVMLKNYLHNTYATLNEDVKNQMRGKSVKVDDFIREATQ